jgi:hypothetical protein
MIRVVFVIGRFALAAFLLSALFWQHTFRHYPKCHFPRLIVGNPRHVSGGENGAIMAGPDGGKPPSLNGGEPGNQGGPVISEFGFEVK